MAPRVSGRADLRHGVSRPSFCGRRRNVTCPPCRMPPPVQIGSGAHRGAQSADPGARRPGRFGPPGAGVGGVSPGLSISEARKNWAVRSRCFTSGTGVPSTPRAPICVGRMRGQPRLLGLDLTIEIDVGHVTAGARANKGAATGSTRAELRRAFHRRLLNATGRCRAFAARRSPLGASGSCRERMAA